MADCLLFYSTKNFNWLKKFQVCQELQLSTILGKLNLIRQLLPPTQNIFHRDVHMVYSFSLTIFIKENLNSFPKNTPKTKSAALR
jgi:hypothetical protein